MPSQCHCRCHIPTATHLLFLSSSTGRHNTYRTTIHPSHPLNTHLRHPFLACSIYEIQLLQGFIGKHNLSPLPATKLSIIHFAALLSLKALAPSTIKVYLSAVGVCHSFQDPCHRNPLLSLVKRGATIVYTTPPPCRAPITRQILHCFIRVTHWDSHLGRQDRIMLVAVFCTAFHGFLRVSEFISPSSASFDPSRHTFLKDLHQYMYTHHFKLNLKWTKTDKSRRGQVILLLARRGPTCPYTKYLQSTHS